MPTPERYCSILFGRSTFVSLMDCIVYLVGPRSIFDDFIDEEGLCDKGGAFI